MVKKEKYEYLMQVLDDYGAFVICSETDLKGRITYVTEEFCRVCGYSKDELIGQNHNIVRDPSNDPEIFRNLWEKLKTGRKVSIERLSNKAKNGSIYYVKANFVPLYKNGAVYGYRSVRIDITKEVELETLKNLLEGNNQSLRLTNTLLKKTVDDKEKSMEVFKDNFLALFTHELKTPLNAIINFSNFIHSYLKKNKHPSDAMINKIESLALKIYNNGLNQQDMINNLLQFARIKAGNLTLHKKYFNLSDFILTIINRNKGLYGKEVIHDMESFQIFADKKICEMIFVNIFTNALKYSRSKVFIIVRKIDAENFAVSIEDDGEGISFKNRIKIFDMFTQTNDKSVLKMERTGSGIGLHTVKLLSDICDKSITVSDSKNLGGARFTLKGKVQDND